MLPFYEPGLEGMVARGMRAGRLSFAGSTELDGVVGSAEVVFVAVGTPKGDDGSADLSNVTSVARRIGRALTSGAVPSRGRPLVVVNKSTVPVGGGDYVSDLIEEGAGWRGVAGFAVVSNPEFLRERSAVYDTLFPDRIVVGADSREPLETMRVLYEPIIGQTFPTELDPRPKTAVPFVRTDLASAEMIKYAANAFLAAKISFINEISTLCELAGADIGRVANGIGLDGRIGSRFLNAGIGWGGSCFPKDVSALRAAASEFGHETPLLDATVAVNETQRRRVIEKLQRHLHTLKGRRIALLGLSFKPNTDDLRSAQPPDSQHPDLFRRNGRRLRPRRGQKGRHAPSRRRDSRVRPLRGASGGARRRAGDGVGGSKGPRPEEGGLPYAGSKTHGGRPQRPRPGLLARGRPPVRGLWT
jgi:UDPglucose 6-dehydrogenase